jgi:pimeloyl-ACP methyl ester carboxylesterase
MGVALPKIPAPALPPLWRESRLGFEARALLRDPVWRGDGVPPGDGRPVLLIPGFLAGDGSLAAMAGWLRRSGYRTHRAGIRANLHCSEQACVRLEARLEALTDKAGRPATIIGQSRGGVLAKALAARRPELVSGVVALGAPVLGQLRVHPLVLAQVGIVAALGSSRVPGLFSLSCLRGPCCAPFREALEQQFPKHVSYVSIYSRSDGIVDWRVCLDPDAEHVEVEASHCGMALNAGSYRAIAAALT